MHQLQEMRVFTVIYSMTYTTRAEGKQPVCCLLKDVIPLVKFMPFKPCVRLTTVVRLSVFVVTAGKFPDWRHAFSWVHSQREGSQKQT